MHWNVPCPIYGSTKQIYRVLHLDTIVQIQRLKLRWASMCDFWYFTSSKLLHAAYSQAWAIKTLRSNLFEFTVFRMLWALPANVSACRWKRFSACLIFFIAFPALRPIRLRADSSLPRIFLPLPCLLFVEAALPLFSSDAPAAFLVAFDIAGPFCLMPPAWKISKERAIRYRSNPRIDPKNISISTGSSVDRGIISQDGDGNHAWRTHCLVLSFATLLCARDNSPFFWGMLWSLRQPTFFAAALICSLMPDPSLAALNGIASCFCRLLSVAVSTSPAVDGTAFPLFKPWRGGACRSEWLGASC